MSINTHDHQGHKFQTCQDYIHALEVERSKIQVFHRELPLCLLLVNQAIEACKHHFSPTERTSECNPDQKSTDAPPAVEEFFPTKRPVSSSHSGVQEEEENDDEDNLLSKDGNVTKLDWLRSVQLWNQTPNPSPKKGGAPRQVVVKEVTAGAFQPFKKDKIVEDSTPQADTSGGKKARRCWSPELHRRFLEALQQLGGSHVATPKQIRELMKVDGLTNDEVKSHLQKYRLHTRRPNCSTQKKGNNNNNNVQAPHQFVVVGGIWVPREYGGDGSGVPNSSSIYTPIARRPPSPKKRQESAGSRGGTTTQLYSPATSSSTYTTTASKP